jgi:hypothetical protein
VIDVSLFLTWTSGSRTMDELASDLKEESLFLSLIAAEIPGREGD